MGKVTVKFVQQNYRKREEMIPMRDGVRLYTAVYEPLAGEPRPVIMIRTPFPLNPYGKTFSKDLRTFMQYFTAAKYIIVFQNVRGRFMSEGEFVDVRPLEGPVNEATDTYDTAEWLIRNLNTNGSIGVKGMSYPGFYATMASLSGHPALKAVSPQAPVTDWFMGDDAHISGITQLPLYPFGISFFKPRNKQSIVWPKPVVPYPEGDLYDTFLEKGPSLFEAVRDKLPFVDQMLQHPNYDEFWQNRNAAANLTKENAPGGKFPPCLVVAGFYDAEDCYGPFEVYRTLKEQVPDTEVFLCAGPWYHGAWKHFWYSSIGDVHFTPWSAEHFREWIEFPFFSYYLEGKGSKPAPVSILPSGETMPEGRKASSKKTTFSNARPDWEYGNVWPFATNEYTLYANADGSLTDFPVPGPERTVEFVSNPARPVPYTGDVLEHFTREAFVADQRFASRRTDVSVYTGKKLTEPLKFYGKVTINLSISIDKPDADVIVKLIDVRPDGYQIPVRIGALPLRFRNSFEHPEPAEPGKVYKVSIRLNDIAHHFMPGHKIMLQVQGSMFPLLALPAGKEPVKIRIHDATVHFLCK
ncbi:MAG: CocE/NonD family hydrolase [Bacteroidales bacterium]|nr:CocE/NonD family hydrolase [Bacteroidales bacterium]